MEGKGKEGKEEEREGKGWKRGEGRGEERKEKEGKGRRGKRM